MEKISKNCYRGELITNPMDIKSLALDKKSVWCKNCWGLRPAAVLLNLQLRLIIRAIENKQLYFVINNLKK